MKNILPNIAPVGALAGIAFAALWLLQVASANVLDALLVLSIALLVILLVIVPWVKNHNKPSLSKVSSGF